MTEGVWVQGDRSFDPPLVEYEESDGDYRAILRFDHEPWMDGEWHPLHSNSHSRYRIRNGHCQWRCRVEGVSQAEAQEVWEFLGDLEAIAIGRGCLEVFIGRDEAGYFAREYAFQTDRPRAVGMSELTRAQFQRACHTIDEID